MKLVLGTHKRTSAVQVLSETKHLHDRVRAVCIVENLLCPPVAQLVEREAYTFVVLGSSPSGRTQEIFNRYTSAVLDWPENKWVKPTIFSVSVSFFFHNEK